MKVIFAGTPQFATPFLQALIDDQSHQILSVYTAPDRPRGRGLRVSPSAVKQLALANGLPVQQPTTLSNDREMDSLHRLQPDLVLVVAYGLLLPQWFLDVPLYGCLNIHPSVLPRWRGAAPIQRALLAGDVTSGICLMRMTAGMDEGPIMAYATCAIDAQDTAGTLAENLQKIGVRLLKSSLPLIEQKALPLNAQDDRQATYAHKISKEESWLDWHSDAVFLARQVRAYNPSPIARGMLDGTLIRFWHAEPATYGESGVEPGTITHADHTGIRVACGQGELILQRIQLPGGTPLSTADFFNAPRAMTFCGNQFDVCAPQNVEMCQ